MNLVKDKNNRYPIYSVEEKEIIFFDYPIDAKEALMLKDKDGNLRYKEVAKKEEFYEKVEPLKPTAINDIDEMQAEQLEKLEKKEGVKIVRKGGAKKDAS